MANRRHRCLSCRPVARLTMEEHRVETHGPLGTLWAGLGMGAYYVALIWINSLLGVFLTPLFIIPLTWLQDAAKARQAAR